jgi:cytoskeletal protein CcmA (bactofilin family)
MAKKLMSVFGVQDDEAGMPAGSPSLPSSTESDAGNAEGRGAATRSLMTLGKTLYFKGELAADEDLLLLGRVEGSINHSENLMIGASGVVVGDLRARTITVKGTVEGDMEATEAVVIAPSANVLGDIVAPRVSIVEGARFNGSVKMPQPGSGRSVRPSPVSENDDLSDTAAERILAPR